MKKTTIYASILLISLSLQSCGVMFGGSKYNANIKVKDNPNAEIYVNGDKIGEGEAKGLYKRNEPLVVEVRKEGCKPKTKKFSNAFRTGNFILSAISWGIIGIGVDLGTGASYKPDHKDNPNVEKVNDKDYNFNIDFSECEKP